MNIEVKVIFSTWLVMLHLFFIGLIFLFMSCNDGRGLGDSLATPTSEQRAQSTAWAHNKQYTAVAETAEASNPDWATKRAATVISVTMAAFIEQASERDSDSAEGQYDPCVPVAVDFDPCATGHSVDSAGELPESRSKSQITASNVSIVHAPVPEPMLATPTATPTRVSAIATPAALAEGQSIGTPVPEPTVAATTVTPTPTPRVATVTPTALVESQQVELEPTVTVPDEETPDSETATAEGVPVVAPCTPFPGSDKDPCERRVPWEWPDLKNPNFVADIWEPWPPFTVRQWVDWHFEDWYLVPHFIVRGVLIPGSTRCASHAPPGVLLKGSATDSLERWSPGTAIDCYTDIAVREYIFGSGPSRITFNSGGRSVDELSADFGTVERDAAYFADITSPLTEALEGYEWIIWLATPLDASQGAWEAVSMWDVQRLNDGSVVSVSRYRGGYDDEAVYLDELEPAIDDFVADTKAAMAHYVDLYGGRIGDSPNAPTFIASPELSSVYEYIKAMGALDVPGFTFTPPPPSPLAPSAPTGLSATLTDDQPPEVHLEWTAPVGSQVESYKIVRTDSIGGETMVVATVSAERLEYTDTNLPTAGTEYTYTVIAVNMHGESAPSTAVTLASTAMTAGVRVVAPCTPYPGSDRDPCERRVPWEWPRLKNPNFRASIWAPWPPYTVGEWADWHFDSWDTVPHFVVRGVPIPGSTRCASHETSVFLPVSEDDPLEAGGPITHIDCYTDIAVREYIFGSGPSRVTLLAGWRPWDDVSPDFGTVGRDAAYFADITSPLVEGLEGYEWIFWLATPLVASQGAWNATSMWDVQRRDDGTIVGVIRDRTRKHDDSEYLNRLEPELNDLVTDTKAAMAHYVELYDGKIGASPNAPSFIASAELSSFYEYIKAMGALDVPGFTFTPPPPSPLVPSAPTGLSATLTDDQPPRVHLEWTAPVGSQVTTYKIVRTDSIGGETMVAATVSAERLEYTDTNLPTAVAEYTYTVIAVNVHGESPPTVAVTLAPTAMTAGVRVVAPCTPYPGSDKDPCERRVPWEWPRLKNSNSRATNFAPWPPFTVREWVDRKFEYWPSVPHFVVRGIPVPGSTRCASHGHPVFLPESATEPLAAGGPIAHIDCYVEIEVREYIFGSGPSRVTMLSAWRAFDDISPDFGSVERDAAYFADISSPLVENLEGYEWIFWLATPLVASQGAWKSTFLWDVQRRDDGTIVGVSRYRAGHDDESEYLDELEPELNDLVADTKAAMAHYVELYGGKIGDSPNAPSFIASPELSSVYEYIKAMGALDVPGFTFTPPPPSPLVPSAPTGLSATLTDDQPPRVHLEWSAPDGSKVESYKIVRVDSIGNEAVVVATVGAESLEYTDMNLLTDGAEYTYTVIAVNAHGESPPSVAVKLRVP